MWLLCSIASYRLGNLMEFTHYPEYRCILGASLIRVAGYTRKLGGGLTDFSDHQVVVYLAPRSPYVVKVCKI